MEIHKVYLIHADVDDALLIDVDYTGLDGRTRSIVAYRASDSYSPLTPVITQWLADHPDQEILPYVPPAEPTPEELRQQMPVKSMVEFRAGLRKVRSPVFPEGIYAADINAMIDQIADLDLQEEVRDYFNLGQYAERINPWVDIFGFLAGLTPEEIDVLWVAR